jgi:hypothetical protein
MRDLVHSLYERIFDPTTRRCFYRFLGKSAIVARVRWNPPMFMYTGEDIKVRLGRRA